MDLIQLTSQAYQLRGGSNAGLIVQDDRAVLVDAGLDPDTAKRILRQVDGLGVRLTAVLITHAHADHFGGAATLRSRIGVPVYAPITEAAIVANPILEPLYLFSGAAPPDELRHKFTLAEACPIDGLLEPGEAVFGDVPVQVIAAPGHAPNQVMVAGGGACFVADALFAPEVLRKHGIPFYVDFDRALDTLDALPGLDGGYAAFVPGHGPAVPEIGPWATENAARLAGIREAVGGALSQADDLGEIIRLTADRLDVSLPNPVIYWLAQTTVLACLASLKAARTATIVVDHNRLSWRRLALGV